MLSKKQLKRGIFSYLLVFLCTSSLAVEAPDDMKEFNLFCPFKKQAREFDKSYHECKHGDNFSCDEFVEIIVDLLPTYDCQRPFDKTPEKNYIVPALWLFGDAALSDYLELLKDLANREGNYSMGMYKNAGARAKQIFISPEMLPVLDGHLSETYSPLIEAWKNENP